MYVVHRYNVYYKDKIIGVFYIFNSGAAEYSPSNWISIDFKEENDIPKPLTVGKTSKTAIPYFENILQEEHRVPGLRKHIYTCGPVRMEEVPKGVDSFSVFRAGADKRDPDYSGKDHSAPHYEGEHTPKGMREWANHYCFNKMSDGTFEAELDEAWWWGGGHNDGGTIHTPIPEEWQDLTYDEFLERVVTLSSAAHYGFTAKDLKEKKGLKEFFGF